MILYSWKRIQRKAGRSSKAVLQILRAMIATSIPRNHRDPLYEYYYYDFSGGSFLLNPYELVLNWFRWKPKEIADYVALASYRSYPEYTLTSDATLDLFHSPVNEDTINNNRLLKICDGKIYFYYEEVTKRRNKIWH